MFGSVLVSGGWALALMFFAGCIAGLVILHLIRLVRRTLTRSGTGVAPLTVLVLVRDQEHFIEGFLRTLTGIVRSLPGEVVVVDTGSCDDTPRIIERLARRPGYLQLVQHSGQVRLGELVGPARVAVLVDLQGPVAVHRVLDSVERLLGETKKRRQRLRVATPQT